METLQKDIQKLAKYLDLDKEHIQIKPTEAFYKYTKDGEGKDIRSLRYDSVNNLFHWYTAQESHHNGDHYDCNYVHFKPTESMLKAALKHLSKLASKQALDEIQENHENEKKNEVVEYLRSKAIFIDAKDVEI